VEFAQRSEATGQIVSDLVSGTGRDAVRNDFRERERENE
jgi:hypothetical protein